MSYSFPEIKAFSGLALQANSFSVPDGALEEASNVVLSKDGIISKRRGFYQYYDPSSDTLNNLANYQDKLFAIFSDKIGYFTDAGSSPNYTGTRSALSGVTVSVTGTRVSRNVLSNRNFYFTTDNGVLKLEAYNSSVYRAGTPPALDLRGKLYGSSGVIADGKLVGWRVVIGRRDANDNLLLGAPSEIFTLTNGSGNAQNARIEITIPSEITSTTDGYFYQLYRSSQVASSSTSIYSDFKLIDEVAFTSAEITAGVSFFVDDIDDILLGAELYTNQNSQEGESQANARPPKCDDMTLYKGHVIYAACTTRQSLSLNVIDATALAPADFIETKSDSTIRRYVARAGVGNQTVTSTSVTAAATKIQITYASHGLANNDSVYINNVVGGTLLTDGLYYVRNRAANTFELSATIGGTSIAWTAETAVDFQGIRTAETAVSGVSWVRAANVVTVASTAHGLSSGMTVYVSASAGGTPDVTLGLYTITVTTANAFTFASVGTADASGNTLTYASYPAQFAYDESSSASVQLATTARGLVKAINRDSSSLIYASYTSGIAQTPGMMNFEAKGFTGAIYVRASGTTAGTAFSPVLPASFSTGTQVYSRNDQLPHTFFSSKTNEPEAVPIANQFPIGARNKAILRVLSLRDSIIVLKEDGVYRVTGDDVFNYSITPIDTTIVCKAASSAVVLNNQVFCLSDQGLCMISESSIQIISRKIEDVIQPILGVSTISTETSAFAYEGERFYGVTTLEPNGTAASITYVYNFLNDSWVSWDVLFTQGLVGPSETLYLITTDNVIAKERKDQTRLDFTGQNYALTVVSIDSTDRLTATVTLGSGVVPEVGDIVYKDGAFSRITGVTLVSGVTWSLEFEIATSLNASDSVYLYSKYDSRIKISPFHAGLVGRMKQVSQMQLHFRDNSVTKLLITFSGDTYGGSEETNWETQLISAGFGNFPFGFDPWGQDDGANIQRRTSPAPICRIYVPRFQQRGTFIQADILHSRAGEALNLQAMSFAVRAYNERISK